MRINIVSSAGYIRMKPRRRPIVTITLGDGGRVASITNTLGALWCDQLVELAWRHHGFFTKEELTLWDTLLEGDRHRLPLTLESFPLLRASYDRLLREQVEFGWRRVHSLEEQGPDRDVRGYLTLLDDDGQPTRRRLGGWIIKQAA